MKKLLAAFALTALGVTAAARAQEWKAPDWLGELKPLQFECKVRLERPRLYVRPEELSTVRARIGSTHAEAWAGVLGNLTNKSAKERMLANAFHYLVTGQQASARTAIAAALELAATPNGDDWEATHKVWPEAVVWDWCHDQFTRAEHDSLLAGIRAQLALAGGEDLETQPPHAGHLVNHMADAHIPAGLAFYDEDPSIFERAVNVAKTQLAAKSVFYREGLSSQGTSYGVTHYQADMRILCELYKGTDLDLFPRLPFMAQAGRYWVYARRPDGQFLRNGDDWLDHRPQNSRRDPRGRPEGAFPYYDTAEAWTSPALSEMLLYAAVRYDDPVLFNEYLLGRDLNRVWTAISDIIWRDPERKAAGPQELPTVRWSGGAAGTLLFRTGWGGRDDVVGMFKVMPLYVKNHDHLDRLSFQIYCRGALAIDSGEYEASLSGYDSDHWLQYYQRTIAHNCLLIRDPDEKVVYRGRPVQADGGMPYPREGDNPEKLESIAEPDFNLARVLAHAEDPAGQYALVTGDATRGYGPKVELVRRTFVFLKNRPGDGPVASFIVHDRVRSSDPTFQKVFLLHSIEEPEVGKFTVRVKRGGDRYSGSMLCMTLLPVNPRIIKVGGPGHEFEVNGANYPIGEKEGDVEAGAWRVEVSAPDTSAETEFLHLLLVYPGSAQLGGTGVASKDKGWLTVSLPGWNVALRDDSLSSKKLEYNSDGSDVRHLIAGLEPGGAVSVSLEGKPLTQGKVGANGCFMFESGQGTVRVELK
ncbi:heparinase II/III-family protein [bacterium]|nr:heparinase II/III-family protein [bacterium]